MPSNLPRGEVVYKRNQLSVVHISLLLNIIVFFYSVNYLTLDSRQDLYIIETKNSIKTILKPFHHILTF